ncbi:MAG: hypothetical protein LBB88_00675 [Planctomycetaceae bacterium]|nr:hypothetical protein [Planctomycetaceae bacterium]
MSNPFYRCLRQRDLSAKGRLPDQLPPTDGQLLRNMITYFLHTLKSRKIL